MEKTFKFISAMALIAAMCLSACNKVEITEDPIDEPGIEVTPSQGWKVAISATMGGAGTKALAEDPDTHNLIATFETTDNIFVYNKTKKTMDSSPLHPDRDGASVTLTGTLAGSYEEGDELVLCYNSGSTGIFNYKDQEGTLPTVADYAKAEINITAEDVSDNTITGAAAFVNMQSIFGFNFTDGTDRVPVKALEVKTDGNKLVTQYGLWQNYLNPNPYQYYGGITIVADDPLSGAVYVALRNDNEGDDTYHFLVNDGAGHLYSGNKTAPAGKIVNGKFYSSTVALTPVALPSVTITAAGTPVGPNAPWDPTLINYGWSDLMFGYANYGDLTISGNSNGSWFEWLTSDHSGGDRTVTLDGATITNPLAETVPLENQDGSFTLVLSGANSITRTAASYGGGIPAISFMGNSICFQGDGTLAVTAATEEAYHCVKGIRGTDSAPNPAAASGYTLTISDGVDNGDGTTTWVYTVRPEATLSGAFSVSGSKRVRFSKGLLYYDGSAWYFEDNQYDFRSYPGSAAIISGSTALTPSGHWGMFGWSTSSTTFGMKTTISNADFSGDFSDWGSNAIVNGGNASGVWRTLSSGDDESGEWYYLINSRTMNSGVPRYARTTLTLSDGTTTVFGIILYPDAYVMGTESPVATDNGSTTWTDWQKMEASNAVFIPATGYRTGTDVRSSGTYGCCWSATSSGDKAYSFDFTSSLVKPEYTSQRYTGIPVRLVCDID